MGTELARRLDAAWTAATGCVSIVEGTECWTGGRLLASAGAIGDALRAHCAAPWEPVGVLVSNRATDLAAFLAVWRERAVVVPIHRDAPRLAAERVLDAARIRLVVDAAADGREARVTTRDATPATDPFLLGAAVVVFTSGSTGDPKGVVLSHEALATKLSANGALLSFEAGGRTQLVLQLTFSFGLWVSLLTITTGGVLAMRRSFELRGALAALVEHRVTRTAWVPTMLRALVAAREDPEVARLLEAVRAAGDLRHLYTGGEILSGSLARAVADLLPGTRLFNIFGLSETATSDFLISGDELLARPGAVGRAATGVAYRIVDSGGRAVPAGGVGELQIHTRTAMNGYLGDPERTAEAFAGPFLRTGDLAREGADGVVEVVGRSKEVISRGANKIYPQEIEQVLQAHPAVGSVLATGVPDALLGERIHVAVKSRVGALDPAALRAWAAERLERFKVPDVIHLVDELPSGATGKADRGELRRRLSAASR